MNSQGLFTWSGGPRSSGVGFFCFHALGDTKQKKPTPLDRDHPLHVNRVLVVVKCRRHNNGLLKTWMIVGFKKSKCQWIHIIPAG